MLTLLALCPATKKTSETDKIKLDKLASAHGRGAEGREDENSDSSCCRSDSDCFSCDSEGSLAVKPKAGQGMAPRKSLATGACYSCAILLSCSLRAAAAASAAAAVVTAR
jgi:hypothetical protein